jgi:hypothetical protein
MAQDLTWLIYVDINIAVKATAALDGRGPWFINVKDPYQ